VARRRGHRTTHWRRGVNRSEDTLPLVGMTVIEIDRGQAQYAGKLFSDLGARVIKVEEPGGSPARAAEPIVNGRSVPFDHYNTAKLSVELDLTTEIGLQHCRGILAEADVLLDGLAVGELAAYGLDDDVLGSLRPGLIVVAITPFGATGPWANRLGSDVVSLAAAGVTAGTGYDSVDGSPALPITPTGGHAAHFGGVMAATYAVAALSTPPSEGVLRLDVSQHDVIAVSTEIPVSLWEFGGQTVFRHTGRHAGTELHSPEWQFLCADGRYVCAITLYMNDRRFAQILDWFAEDGLDSRLRDERFASIEGRTAHMHEIAAVMADFFSRRDSDKVFHEAQRRQLPWARVESPADVRSDPQLHARGFFTTTATADGADILQVGLPWIGLPTIFSTGMTRRRAPLIGEDNDAVLDRA